MRRPAPVRGPRPAPRRAPASDPIARVAHRTGAIVDSPVLDRLTRGRLWIPLIAVALMGLVFLQVSLLQLNSGIGRAVQTAATLERENAVLRAEVSRLDSGERIQAVAAGEGLVMPAPGDRRYLTARASDGREAARALTAPDPVVQQPAAALGVAGAAPTGTGAVADAAPVAPPPPAPVAAPTTPAAPVEPAPPTPAAEPAPAAAVAPAPSPDPAGGTAAPPVE